MYREGVLSTWVVVLDDDLEVGGSAVGGAGSLDGYGVAFEVRAGRIAELIPHYYSAAVNLSLCLSANIDKHC